MKKICDTCGGSGQISYFKGVSRFLLSCEDCPACSGLGFMLEDEGKSEGALEVKDESLYPKKSKEGKRGKDKA